MKFDEYEFKQAIKKADLMLRPNALFINPELLKAMGEDAKAELEKQCVVHETPLVDIKQAFVVDRVKPEDFGTNFEPEEGVDVMYESPIQKFWGDVYNNVVQQDEEHCMATVRMAVGYEVDKDELIKALHYDREQYEKGYRDGYEKGKLDAIKEICYMTHDDNDYESED